MAALPPGVTPIESNTPALPAGVTSAGDVTSGGQTGGGSFFTGPKIPFTETRLPNIQPAPITLAMPPGASLGAGVLGKTAAGILGRTALQGIGSAGQAAIEGKVAPKELATEAGKGALWNLAAEAIFGGLGKMWAMARGAETAGGKVAHDKAMTEALNTLEEQAYKEAVKGIRDEYAETLRQARNAYQTAKQAAEAAHTGRVATQEAAHAGEIATHADLAASKIADEIKKNVPAVADMPSTTRGLVDMVYGEGKNKVSAAFDAAMKEIAEKAAGQQVQVPIEAARRLGFTMPPNPLEGISAGPFMVPVDAAQLASKATGAWAKDPGAYRAAVNALDAANLGDPAARAAYKFYVGMANYIDKTKALAGETLHPEALLKGATSLKAIEELRRRGIGDVFRGPIQAARGGPVAPAEIPGPVMPPFMPPARPSIPAPPMPRPEPSAPDIRAINVPEGLKHVLGGGPGGYMGGWPGYALGAILGHTVIPSQIVTRAPVSPAAEQAIRVLTPPVGVGAKGLSDLAMDALQQRKKK